MPGCGKTYTPKSVLPLGRVPAVELEPGVPPVSWHSGLEVMAAAATDCDGLNISAGGLLLHLRASKGSSCLADGVQALKLDQSVVIGNFRSGHMQACMLFNHQLRVTTLLSFPVPSAWILRILEQ